MDFMQFGNSLGKNKEITNFFKKNNKELQKQKLCKLLGIQNKTVDTTEKGVTTAL